VNRLLDLDAFLELRFLKLNADALLKHLDVLERIEPKNRDAAAVRNAESFDAFHSRRLTGAVWPDQSKDLAVIHVERDILDGDELLVGFPEIRDLDDRSGSHHAKEATEVEGLCGDTGEDQKNS